jgi:hypothetical protein
MLFVEKKPKRVGGFEFEGSGQLLALLPDGFLARAQTLTIGVDHLLSDTSDPPQTMQICF